MELLHEVITSKRSRSVALSILEPIMLRLMDLCVELKKSKQAREALHQYKNAQQNTSIPTIELVVRHYVNAAETRLKAAQAEAQAESGDGEVEDLEAVETPESILLATVSTDSSKERTDRSVVTPWLRMVWESYRSVLDILRNNARLEGLYQIMTQKAFQFCESHTRKLEFRRLCDLLRTHLSAATKYAHQAHSIDLTDPDTLQRHLDTRSAQLNVAVELDLWQEAFRTVEDIHHLLALAKRAPRPHMMRNYYAKLARIFLVSDNLLFHAAARLRHYQLWRMQGDASPETSASMASGVLLSILAIPIESSGPTGSEGKSGRLTHLLGLTSPPTRTGLLQDAYSRGVLLHASSSVKALHDALEVRFHPLSICKTMAPLLEDVEAEAQRDIEEDLGKDARLRYVRGLRRVVLSRLLQQLSQVYTTLRMERLQKLVAPLQEASKSSEPTSKYIQQGSLEQAILTACRRGDLTIRMDHATGVLHFGSAANDAEGIFTIRSTSDPRPGQLQSSLPSRFHHHLSCLDRSLSQAISTSSTSTLSTTEAEATAQKLKEAAEWIRQENLARKAFGNKRRQLALAAQAAKEREEAEARAARQAQEAKAAAEAAERRTRERAVARMEAEKAAIAREEARKLAESMNLTDPSKVASPGTSGPGGAGEGLETTDALMALQMRRLEKEKAETASRLKATGKRLDHMERACRREEVPLLDADAKAQAEADAAAHKRAADTTIAQARERYAHIQDAAKRLGRLRAQAQAYGEMLRARRQEKREEEERKAQEAIDEAINERLAAYREVKAKKEEQEAEEDRIRREKEEQEAKEREEREAKERAETEAKAKAKAEEAERLRKLDEQAAKQRERERLAEEKIAARSMSGGRAGGAPSGARGKYVPPSSRRGTADTPSPPSSRSDSGSGDKDESKPKAWRPRHLR